MTPAGVVKFVVVLLVRVAVQSGSTLTVLLINAAYGTAAVALYSAAFSAIALSVILFRNGLPVLLLRHFVNHPNADPDQILCGFQTTLVRNKTQYAKLLITIMVLSAYLAFTLGHQAFWLFGAMLPLVLILPVLTLNSAWLKATGQTIRASIFDPGLANLFLAAIIGVGMVAGATGLVSIFTAAFAALASLATVVVFSLLRRTAGADSLSDPTAQRKILLNACLVFLFRNGYPLLFAVAIIAADLGQFRLEERLFYLLMFFYTLFETLSMKRLIRLVSPDNVARVKTQYLRTAAAVLGAGLILALLMWAFLSVENLSGLLGYRPTDGHLILMALATPFYFLTLFNNRILNLLGHHRSVSVSLLTAALVFILIGLVLYSPLGIDGIRLSYLFGGIAGSVVSSLLLMRQFQG